MVIILRKYVLKLLKSAIFGPNMAQNGTFGDITRLVGRVMGSNLVQSGSSTFAGMLEVLSAAIDHKITRKALKTSVK